jgi:hypothetical protein
MIAVASFRTSLKLAAVVTLYVILLVGGGLFGTRISEGFSIEIWPHTEPMINRIVVGGLLLYIVLTAIPFVPGIELGMALIVAFGARIVPAVYLATVAALLTSFLVGRLVPVHWLAVAFEWMGFRRAQAMVMSYAAIPGEERVAHLMTYAPQRWVPWLLRYRFVALGLLFNLPGSALLGGGGGIAMAAGMSRLVSFPKFIITAALAVSPVPFLLLLTSR